MDNTSPSLLCSWMDSANFLKLYQERCSSPFATFVHPYWTQSSVSLSSYTVKPNTGSSTSDVSHQCQAGWKDHLLLLAIQWLGWSTTLLAFFAVRMRSWFMFNVVFTKSCRFYSIKLLFSCLVPSLYRSMGLSLPMERTGHFVLFNLMRLLSDHFSSVPKSLWRVAQPSVCQPLPSALGYTQTFWGCTLICCPDK